MTAPPSSPPDRVDLDAAERAMTPAPSDVTSPSTMPTCPACNRKRMTDDEYDRRTKLAAVPGETRGEFGARIRAEGWCMFMDGATVRACYADELLTARARIAELEADVAAKQRGYVDLHQMVPGQMDIWTKVDALVKRERALVADIDYLELTTTARAPLTAAGRASFDRLAGRVSPDGAAPAPVMTVGEALDAQPIVEYRLPLDGRWFQRHNGVARWYRDAGAGHPLTGWCPWFHHAPDEDRSLPCRLVPLADADADPASRGPL